MSISYENLSTLIKTNPDYLTLSSTEIKDWVNTKAVSKTLDRLNAEVMYEAVDTTDFTGLSADQQAEVWNILLLHATSGIPTTAGSRARTRLISLFGGGSTTISNMVGAITYLVSRATDAEVGADEVNEGQVEEALRLNP